MTVIVAEISCNHNGSKQLAYKLIDAAAESGADAVKFQLYRPEQMVHDRMVRAEIPSGPWKGRSPYALYRDAMTPADWIEDLFDHAGLVGIPAFTSVFDPADVPWLEDLGCPRYKVASAEAMWPELLDALVMTAKPLVVSDGMVTGEELRWLHGYLYGDVTLLRCVSDYPAKAASYGFGDNQLPFMSWASTQADFRPKLFTWGVSDHSCDPLVAVTAAAMGASMIEAHLMLPGTDPLDAGHSYLPHEFADMVQQVRAAAAMRERKRQEPSADAMQWRRRLVWAKDMEAAQLVEDEHVVTLRAPEGMEPYRKGEVVGKHMACWVSAGTGVDPEDVG